VHRQKRKFRKVLGANLVEYSLLLLLILVGAVLSLNLFSDAASQRFSTITSAIEGV